MVKFSWALRIILNFMRDPISLWVSLFIIALVLLASVIAVQKNDFAQKHSLKQEVMKKESLKKDILFFPPNISEERYRGNPAADIVVIEYSDLECPFCKNFHQKFQKYIFNEQDGKVTWVFRHFPLERLHLKARAEALATECAFSIGGNDAFWKYTDELYRITPSNDGLDLTLLPEMAIVAGLEKEEFTDCIERNPFNEIIDAHKLDGLKSGVDRTPSVLLWNKRTGDRKIVSGANSRFNEVQAILANWLDQELPMIETPPSNDSCLNEFGVCNSIK